MVVFYGTLVTVTASGGDTGGKTSIFTLRVADPFSSRGADAGNERRCLYIFVNFPL